VKAAGGAAGPGTPYTVVDEVTADEPAHATCPHAVVDAGSGGAPRGQAESGHRRDATRPPI
jgi:hypothetical protein